MKIGVFDSGLGGLTVVQAMTKHIKGAQLFYLADTKNAPYGEKSVEQILQYSLEITQFFIDNHEIDALIVACNTATSAAIHHLRERYPSLIIIGTEPGIKPAISLTKTKNVGVLATPATLKGDKYQKLANELAHGKDIVLFEQACPGLVEQIEKGEIDTPKTKEMLESWLGPMKAGSVDVIVLGCTHYPLVGTAIQSVMQTDVFLVDTGEAIAKRLLSLSGEKGHVNEGRLEVSIYFTDRIDQGLINTIIPEYKEIKLIGL